MLHAIRPYNVIVDDLQLEENISNLDFALKCERVLNWLLELTIDNGVLNKLNYQFNINEFSFRLERINFWNFNGYPKFQLFLVSDKPFFNFSNIEDPVVSYDFYEEKPYIKFGELWDKFVEIVDI